MEFIQVSANTRTLLAPAGQLDTVSKLRGVELHHFAAFYQSSWRAWDWMWGRLDGSGWLVHILLDPRRILAVVEDSCQWEAGTRAGNFAALLRDTLGIPSGLDDDCLAADLRFLDQPEAPIPVSLPNSALFLAQAWQDLIAADELPVVAQQMNADAGHPLTSGWASDVLTMHEKDKPPAEFAGKLTDCARSAGSRWPRTCAPPRSPSWPPRRRPWPPRRSRPRRRYRARSGRSWPRPAP